MLVKVKSIIFDNEDGTFPKNFNAEHWRTPQAIYMHHALRFAIGLHGA